MRVRAPAVAGLFYPDNPAELNALLGTFTPVRDPPATPPRALIVPHAGLIYSGALAYRALSLVAGQRYRYILMVGPSHRLAFTGLAVPEAELFRTPFGDFALATEQIAALVTAKRVRYLDAAHAAEHCLEVQLPLLRKLAIEGPLVPVVVGDASVEEVAGLIATALADEQALVLVSSDLSHYHSQREAQQLDSRTSDLILARKPVLRPQDACGSYGINGLLSAIRESGARIECVGRCTSGDVCGDMERVVGYGAYAVYAGAAA